MPHSTATGQTIVLIVTFGVAIGLIVTLLLAYIVAEVLAEHKQNQEGQPPTS